jgi:acetyl esterase/lipase
MIKKSVFLLLALFSAPVLPADVSSDQRAGIRYAPVPSNIELSAVAELPYRDSDYRLAYGDDPLQYGELWLPQPTSEKRDLIVLIHGGCWSNQYGIAQTYPLSMALANAGYAVWSLEYRRSGDSSGGWPGSYEDIVAGVEYAANLDRSGVAIEDVAIVGHSSGGHLALLAGSGKDVTALDIDMVVGLAAITDVIDYAAGSNSCQVAAAQFMGGDFQQIPQLYHAANPSEYSFLPNTILLHGDADQIVPLQQLALLSAEAYVFTGASHFDWIHPSSPAFAFLLQLLQQRL